MKLRDEVMAILKANTHRLLHASEINALLERPRRSHNTVSGAISQMRANLRRKPNGPQIESHMGEGGGYGLVGGEDAPCDT